MTTLEPSQNQQETQVEHQRQDSQLTSNQQQEQETVVYENHNQDKIAQILNSSQQKLQTKQPTTGQNKQDKRNGKGKGFNHGNSRGQQNIQGGEQQGGYLSQGDIQTQQQQQQQQNGQSTEPILLGQTQSNQNNTHANGQSQSNLNNVDHSYYNNTNNRYPQQFVNDTNYLQNQMNQQYQTYWNNSNNINSGQQIFYPTNDQAINNLNRTNNNNNNTGQDSNNFNISNPNNNASFIPANLDGQTQIGQQFRSRHGFVKNPKSLIDLKKTKMCINFASGSCLKGDLCSFAHNESELKQKPNLNKTKLCQEFEQTGKCQNGNCVFAHGTKELRHTDDFYKTSMCFNFSKDGKCESGDNCRYAHGEAELKKRVYQDERWFGKKKHNFQHHSHHNYDPNNFVQYPHPSQQLDQEQFNQFIMMQSIIQNMQLMQLQLQQQQLQPQQQINQR